MLDNGALSGVKVLDLSRLLPGPYCSMILADHGAEVIAVEDRKFKEDLFFNEVNRNKRHMSLNLKTEQGRKIFFRLAKEADVLLEGFRPGVVKRLGVGYEVVKKINPDIIYCSITGYGQTGPLRDRVGHDVNYLSTAGILDLIGASGAPPSIPGLQFADIAGGSMNAVIGILLALHVKEKTGKGQYIDISITDGMTNFLMLPYFFNRLLGRTPQRSNELLSHRYACYNTYETADGRFISIGAVEHQFWKRLCEHFDVPEYIGLQYDDGHREVIIDFMRKTFKKKTVAKWDKEFADIEVCYAKIQNLEEVMNDPFFKEREMVVDFAQKNGKIAKTFGIPVKLSETPGTIGTEPDVFGGSTQDILREMGYSKEQIDEFANKGIT